MAKWDFAAMGQAGLTGWTRTAARPAARLIAGRTGRLEADILALIGAGFLAITVIGFLRNVDAVIAPGEPALRPGKPLPPAARTGPGAEPVLGAGGARKGRKPPAWMARVARLWP